jgi:hypothetical protein
MSVKESFFHHLNKSAETNGQVRTAVDASIHDVVFWLEGNVDFFDYTVTFSRAYVWGFIGDKMFNLEVWS